MYYNITNLRPLKRRQSPRSLRDITTRYIADSGMKFRYSQLPAELAEAIFGRRHRLIYQQKQRVEHFQYPDRILETPNRVSSLVLDPDKLLYMRAVCMHPMIVRVLSQQDDRVLNTILLDYVSRSTLLYVNIRQCPYCD